jgi:tripartite-type tricarboxylate transporter receptor subunit TctC
MKPMIRSTVILAAMGLTIAQTRTAVSQESYPSRAIRMIVPLPAGGPLTL